MSEYPTLWALLSIMTGTIEYSSTDQAAVLSFYNSLPDDLREVFEVLEYRVNINNEIE